MPDEAGLLIPAIAARLHAMVVPATDEVGEYENTVLLHMEVVASELVNVGIGLTLTSMF